MDKKPAWHESAASSAIQTTDSTASWVERALRVGSVVAPLAAVVGGIVKQLVWPELLILGLIGATVAVVLGEVISQRRARRALGGLAESAPRLGEENAELKREALKMKAEMAATAVILHEQYTELSERADARVDEERERWVKIQADSEITHALAMRELCDELGIAKTERDLAKAEAKKDEDLRYYGATLEEIAALDPHHFAAMIQSAQKLTPLLETLDATSDAMWAYVRAESDAQPESSPIVWLRVCIGNYEHRFAVNARNELGGFLANGRDPRAILAQWYVAYRTWRTKLGQLAACLGKQLVEIRGFTEWRAAEVALASMLNTELATDAFKRVRERVKAYDGTHGTLADPPPLLSTAEFGEYGSIVRRIASATPNENRFLGLFVHGVPAMVPGQENTYLEHIVYQAGAKLVADGVLIVRKDETGRETFTLTSMAYRAWMASERVQPASKFIIIDPAATEGTGSSGGGAVASVSFRRAPMPGVPYIEQSAAGGPTPMSVPSESDNATGPS